MKNRTAFFVVLSLFLSTACAPVQQPKPDPVKEELSILQKQVLELQQLQNDTMAKLDQSTATISALSAKLRALEERQGIKTLNHPQLVSKPSTTTADKKKAPSPKKKTAKKGKKKVRRQE